MATSGVVTRSLFSPIFARRGNTSRRTTDDGRRTTYLTICEMVLFTSTSFMLVLPENGTIFLGELCAEIQSSRTWTGILQTRETIVLWRETGETRETLPSQS